MSPSLKLTNRPLKMSRNLKRKGSSSNRHFQGLCECQGEWICTFLPNFIDRVLHQWCREILVWTLFIKMSWVFSNCAKELPCILPLNIVSCVFPFGSTLNVFTSTGAGWWWAFGGWTSSGSGGFILWRVGGGSSLNEGFGNRKDSNVEVCDKGKNVMHHVLMDHVLMNHALMNHEEHHHELIMIMIVNGIATNKELDSATSWNLQHILFTATDSCHGTYAHHVWNCFKSWSHRVAKWYRR